MPRVDVDKLETICAQGTDPEGAGRVKVSRRWLRAVLAELRELERLRSREKSAGGVRSALKDLFGGGRN